MNLRISRHLIPIFFLAASLLATTVRAAIQFDVFIGYDQIVREASWFPIICEMKNDGPPFVGLIELTPDTGSGQTQRIPVELPTGTLKRLTIPAFESGRYSSRWTARLLDDRGKVRAEQISQAARRHIGWEIPLIGSLSRTASGAAQLRQIARDQSELQPASARFQRDIFPDNPLVLEALNALYLSSEVAANLRESQVQAILGWLNAGGHLIVGVEQISDITALPWLRSIMPCEPKEMRTVSSHPALHEWLRGDGWENGATQSRSSATKSADRPFGDLPADSAFELADLPVVISTLRDGRVVVGAGDAPLIVTANRGMGRVTALMFSPEREPFKSWKHLTTFWSRIAEVPGALYVSTDMNQHYGESADGIFGAMIDSRQVHKLPVGWLLLLLLVYLIIIGPLDQWWLKRIGKPMLTWITFPCYVALFSLLIYFIGYKLRAGEAEYNELHVVDVLRNGDKAELRGRTYATIYSPSNEKYPVESKQKVATFRGEFLNSGGGSGTEKVNVLHSGDTFKADVFVPVWTSQLYVSDWWQPAAPPLSVKIVRAGDGHWEVTVQNQTDKPVKSSRLVVDGNVHTLGPGGEIPAGQTKTFTVTSQGGTPIRQFVQQHGNNFHSAASSRQQSFGDSSRGQINDLPNASIAASFVTQTTDNSQNYYQSFIAPPGLDLTRVVERGTAEFFAWMPDYAPVKPLNQFTPKRSFRHTLWRVPVEIKN